MAAELGSDMPFCLDGGTQLCFGHGEQLEALPINSSQPQALLLIKHPEVSVSTPWAYGRCKELRGDFYLEAEADFEQRRQALRQAPLLGAVAGNGNWPLLRNDLQAVVEPEVETVRQGLALLRQSEQPLAVAMSGSGPSLFALFPGVDQARSAHADLAERFERDGFESWCCGFSDRGVSLIQ